MNFDFSIGFDREIEGISPYVGTLTECTELLQSLLNHDKIIIGEKSEGNVMVDDGLIYLDYRWCSDVGEDWDSDIWNDEFEHIPIDEVQ